MALGMVIPIVLWPQGNTMVRSILIGSGIVVLFGLVDDFRDVSYGVKFTGQVLAGLVAIFYGGVKITSLGMLLPEGTVLPEWVAAPLTLLVIVGVTNAINLADGLDGLAGGISILSFALIGYLAYRVGNRVLAFPAFAMVGAIFGFLRFNTYPATVFMGDAGSQLLGFVAVTLAVGLTQVNEPLSPLLPLVVLGFPVLDTLTVMLGRIAKGDSPFKPDKKHFHHRLLKLGLFHTEAVVIIYVVQAFLVLSAFFLRYDSDWLILVFYLVFSGLVLGVFLIAEGKGWHLHRPTSFFDRAIKGRLKVLKEKQVLIKVSFRTLAYGAPFLFFITCLMPGEVPLYLGGWALLLGVLVVVLRKTSARGIVLRSALYLTIPFVVYQGEIGVVPFIGAIGYRVAGVLFGLMVVVSILTMKFTRRQKGFKTTPMDFLILLVALVVPNLPDFQDESIHMGIIAVKMIVLFFSYEVLIGELRGEVKSLGWATVGALGVVCLKALVAL